VAGWQLPSVACGAVVLRRRRAGGVMARQRQQAVKGRVGQAPWRARAALRVGGEAEALWRTAAVAAAGTALARRAARHSDGTIRRLGGSGLALRGWRGAACCIAREARERIPAFARLAWRVLWLCCCCVHAWGRVERGRQGLARRARTRPGLLVCVCGRER